MDTGRHCDRERRGETHSRRLSWRPTRYGFFWLCPECWEEVRQSIHDRT